MTQVTSKSKNEDLGAAKSAKKDEFYTQYIDIQKEVEVCCQTNCILSLALLLAKYGINHLPGNPCGN